MRRRPSSAKGFGAQRTRLKGSAWQSEPPVTPGSAGVARGHVVRTTAGPAARCGPGIAFTSWIENR